MPSLYYGFPPAMSAALSAAESSNAASVIEDSVVLDTRSKKNSSDEESQWLDALEAGTLDDFGELPPKNRDHSHLTARQVVEYYTTVMCLFCAVLCFVTFVLIVVLGCCQCRVVVVS